MTREEAIEKVKDMRDYIIREHSPNDVFISHMNEAIEALKNQRPHGEWINEDYGIGECFAECSECGEETNGEAKDTGFGYDYSFPNYCPNCGAKMRKEGDEK